MLFAAVATIGVVGSSIWSQAPGLAVGRQPQPVVEVGPFPPAEAVLPGENPTEVSLGPVATAASVTAISATFVRTTALSALPIPSPDSSGVAWIRHQSRLLVVDSEVNEIPRLFDANATNVYPIAYGGSLVTTQVGNTLPWTKEPTGVTYNPANTHIFVSDDNADMVYEFDPGPDRRYATSDDTVTNLNTRPFGNWDAEDVAYDTTTGDLWVVDGFKREVFRYSPGPDGEFGTADDPAPSNWDVGMYGAIDPEGIAHYEADDTLFVLDSGSDKIYVLSKTGALLRTIGIAAAHSKKAAGLTLAPPSAGGSGLNLYIVDRGVDNTADPSENDGKLYEMAAGLLGDSPNAVIGPNGRRCFSVTGSPGDAAVVNLTPVEASGQGFGVLVSSNVTTAPVASSVNFTGPQTVDPNVAVAPIGADGKICYINSGLTSVDLVADHLGTIDGDAYTPAKSNGTPDRKVDTRVGLGGKRMAPNGRVCFSVTGSPGDAAVVNLTPVEASGQGFGVLVSSNVTTLPVASSVNFTGSQTVDPNVAIVTIGADGKVCYVNSKHTSVHLVADHLGTIARASYTNATAAGAPNRIIDTR